MSAVSLEKLRDDFLAANTTGELVAALNQIQASAQAHPGSVIKKDMMDWGMTKMRDVDPRQWNKQVKVRYKVVMSMLPADRSGTLSPSSASTVIALSTRTYDASQEMQIPLAQNDGNISNPMWGATISGTPTNPAGQRAPGLVKADDDAPRRHLIKKEK